MKKEAISPKKVSRIKHVLVAVALVLVLVFFMHNLVQAISPEPRYDDFCTESYKPEPITKQECQAMGEGWRWAPQEKVGATEGFCDGSAYFEKCQKSWNIAEESYWGKVFYVYILAGIAIILFSFFLSVEAVSNGLMGGGILLIVYASMRNWEWLSDLGRVILLGLALIALIYLGYKKLK